VRREEWFDSQGETRGAAALGRSGRPGQYEDSQRTADEGTDDCTTRVLEVHERVMEVNQADAVPYQEGIQAGTSVTGFSTSTSP